MGRIILRAKDRESRVKLSPVPKTDWHRRQLIKIEQSFVVTVGPPQLTPECLKLFHALLLVSILPL